MFTLFETPSWFAGFDLILDTIAFLITILISSYSFKAFKLSKNKKFGYFSLAFALMSIAFLFKLATYAVVYYSASQLVAFKSVAIVTGAENLTITSRDLLYRFGFFVQMAASLGSLLLIYLTSQKSRDRLKSFTEMSQIALFGYFVLLISVVSTFKYFVFYLSGFVLLALIVLNYYQNYLKVKSVNSFKVLVAFALLLISQLCFTFVFLNNSLYFFGELFTIAGFSLLAIVYMKINRKQKRIAIRKAKTKVEKAKKNTNTKKAKVGVRA